MAKLLVVEDDMDIAQGLAEFLQPRGHTLDFAYTGTQAMSLLSAEVYDLILLDLNLPMASGYDVCRSLVSHDKVQLASTPVIIMSARSLEEDILKGFESGAWDYLVKPFSFSELLARVNVNLSKLSAASTANKRLSWNGLGLDCDTMTLSHGEVTMQLHQTGFDLFRLLIETAPNPVKTIHIQHTLWGDEIPDSDPLRANIYKIRKQCQQHFGKSLIATVKGVGYKLSLDIDKSKSDA